MEYQIDARVAGIVRVGQDEREIAVFRKAGFFSFNLEGRVDGDYQLKLAAPWTGFRYLLRSGRREIASAKRRTFLHAFDPGQPLTRHRQTEFDLDVDGRQYRLVPEDRFGLTVAILAGDERVGELAMRTFEGQQQAEWQADLRAPDPWPVPLAAFVPFLTREGRRFMKS